MMSQDDDEPKLQFQPTCPCHAGKMKCGFFVADMLCSWRLSTVITVLTNAQGVFTNAQGALNRAQGVPAR